MSDFTPGPWRIGAIESGMVAIDGANGEEVTGFVFQEDGRLIAAAPDLLEVLKHIRRCIPYGGFVQIHDNSMTLAQIDAAIAKAEGGAA